MLGEEIVREKFSLTIKARGNESRDPIQIE
jgi:hypothetical protein